MLRLFKAVRTGSGANSRIARGVGVVAVFTVIGRLAGALKEMAVAYRFGVSEVVDAYTLAFTMATLAPVIWAVVLVSVYIPLSRRLAEHERDAFVGQLMGLTVLLGGTAALIVGVLLPLLVPYIWTDLSLNSQRYVQQLFIGFAPIVLGMFVAALLAAKLLALEHHSNTLMEALPSLCIAAVVLLFPHQESISPFIYGGILGVIAQVLGLHLILKSGGHTSKLAFGFNAAGWQRFRNAIGLMVLGQFILSFGIPIDFYFASQFGEGAVSSYGYAYRILVLFLTLGATVIGRAILPVLSDTQARTEKNRIAFKWMMLLFYGGCFAALVGWFFMPVMVQLLFERGAFTADNTREVTHIIRFGLLQLPAYFAGIVIVQLLLSQEKFFVIFLSSITGITIKLVAGYFGAKMFGLPGIMGSWFFVYGVNLVFLAYHAKYGKSQPVASNSK